MKMTTAEQRFVMPAEVMERVEVLRKKQEDQTSFAQGINKFFGLETKHDQAWFYGFYGTAISIVLFMVFVSNMLNFLF
ncbi:DUF3961 domain-containing protein [Bacillus manliponensis]|uniref:DUF3961 domain-containing protein n=1 Tax=Bacillus manliponensis TaxID=574376 RepID=UPI0035147DB6